ncbi:MAG: hypothetical protein ACR2PL_07855 [Dehalococcoidia bacterium]
MRRQLWGAHPFIWAATCVIAALLAILVAVTVFGDPHRSARRTFLIQCRDQAEDAGGPDHCAAVARDRFGTFNSLPQDMTYGVAAVAVFTGTVFVLIYVMRRVDETVVTSG